MPSVTFSDEPMPSRSIDNELAAYIHNSNDVLSLKLVRSPEDFHDEAAAFHPEMTHQIYKEEEIFGFKDVSIKLYYAASSLNIFLQVSAEGSIKDKHGIDLDGDLPDVEKPLRGILPEKVTTNADEFLKSLADDATFKPYGHQVHSFTKDERTFDIFHCDVVHNPGFKDFHDRLQTFTMFFIDGASYIDTDDDKWQFFVVYEKYKCDGDWRHAVVGYATVYEYYAYPDKKRPRISQFLVLPPFQRRGVGAELLRSIYRYYQNVPTVVDITVEDPSDEFLMLRHFVDSCLCRKLDSFRPEKLREGFSKDMCEEANRKYKLNSKQVRRVYEILRLGVTNIHDEDDLRLYRLDVKKRFFAANKESARALKVSNSQMHKDVKDLLLTTCNPDVTRAQLKEAFETIYPLYTDIWSKVDRTREF